MDSVNLSTASAAGISLAIKQDMQRVETPERMAWIVWLLKNIADTEDNFPCGKWATIQHIESQVELAAEAECRKFL